MSTDTSTSHLRSFSIPGCAVIVQSEGNEGIPVQDFLALAFNLAASNPEARIDFSLKVMT